jgi:hypothetical protein
MRAEADFNVGDFHEGVQQDDKALVRFYMKPVQGPVNPLTGGTEWREKEYYETVVPGSRDTINQPVTEFTKKKYPLQYAKWKANQSTEGLTGTFISEVTWISRAQAEELAYFGVKTLEQLAAAPDTLCQKQIGMYDLRRKAISFIEQREKDAPILAVHAQLDKLKAENEVKDQTIDALKKRLDALEAQQAEKKGK